MVCTVFLALLYLIIYPSLCIHLSSACSTSIPGVFLRNHVISTVIINDVSSCYYFCKDIDICQSLNYHIKEKKCEVNNRTAVLRKSHIVYSPDATYFENPDRVLLGTSFQLPALSCEEIKNDSKGTPESQFYWVAGNTSIVPTLIKCNFSSPDSCVSSPCLNGGICKNLDEKKFKCLCTPAFTGNRCESPLRK